MFFEHDSEYLHTALDENVNMAAPEQYRKRSIFHTLADGCRLYLSAVSLRHMTAQIRAAPVRASVTAPASSMGDSAVRIPNILR